MKVVTKYPFCVESLDYQEPIGAVNDNTSNAQFILDVEKFINKEKLCTLELGCAGGQIVYDLIKRGHAAYGLEGTPYPLEKGRTAWVEYGGKNLFNCDLSKPFELLDDEGDDMKFDVISHWEFAEHLPTECLDYLFARLYLYLEDDGVILGCICPWGINTDWSKYSYTEKEKRALGSEVAHHISCFPREEWEERFFSKLYETSDYPLSSVLRDEPKSFRCMLKKKVGKKYLNLANKIVEEYEKEFEGK